MKKVLILLAVAAFLVSGYAQDKEEKKDTGDAEKKMEETKGEKKEVYHEIVLEDFETSQYTNDNIKFRKTKEQEAGLTIRTQFPAPTGKSTKYLGVKVNGKQGDVFIIKPTKELIIEKFCQSISMWIYSKGFSADVYVLLQDVNGKVHHIRITDMKFKNWRKLTVRLSKDVIQKDEFLTQKKTMKIIQIQYRPHNQGRLPKWQYFYIDDIEAMVRDKYTDMQSDDW